MSDLPKTWDTFSDFFEPVQKKLRAQGMRHAYGLWLHSFPRQVTIRTICSTSSWSRMAVAASFLQTVSCGPRTRRSARL